ncbi:MAG: M1 family metallopeptidase [Anaerolineae bacterium]|nr:M1 family metallopeptidase [Anaerolineae bacterium]
MNRNIIVLALITILAFSVYQVNELGVSPKSALAQEGTAPQNLYMPGNVQKAFDNGTRSPDGNPGESYWQNRSEHTMTINVMPPNRQVSATEEITYYNNSPTPLPVFVIRLYLNVHQQEATRAQPVMPNFISSGIVIDEFRVNGETKPVPTLFSPGSTLALLNLDEPLQPNESISFYFRWHFDLTDAVSLGDGTAWKEGAIDETTFFLGYFYPRVAVFDDIDGWDTTEFNLGGEWYGDFVDYTFEVNAPRNFVVWATGDLLNPDEVLQPEYAQRLEESMTSDEVISIAQPDEIQDGLVTAQDDIVTWRWQADNVRDIGIALSDHYFWDAGSVVVDPDTDRRASVQAVYNEEATDFQQMVEFGKSALEFGSTEWPGVPYPYSKTTIIRGGADEEYPMMANDSSEPEDLPYVRFVAAHELLHSWFPFYMGIDERRYPMLDEGWVTAFEHLINTRDMGAADATTNFYEFRIERFMGASASRDIPIITPLDAMQFGTNGYAANPYGKAAQGYLALKELMGDEAFKAALHEFMARWNGKHPLPWDMFNTFNDVADQDLTWFFNAWFFEPNYADLALESVEPADDGYEIQIRNVGGWPIPFDVNVIYADGSEESFRQNPSIWQDSPDEATITIDSDQELQSVTLDGGVIADIGPDDNTWESE